MNVYEIKIYMELFEVKWKANKNKGNSFMSTN